MRVAYVVPYYPAPSHRFILQEIVKLRELGADVATFSVRRARPEEILTQQDRQEFERTHAVLPASPRDVIRSQLAALCRPRRCLAALRVMRALRAPGLRGALWQLFYLAEAAILWRRCAALGIRHLHAVFGSNSADAALLAATLGGAEWIFSLTLHGPTDFRNATQLSLAEKISRADLVVCASDFARSQACALVDDDEWAKIRMLHHGTDVRRFAPRAGADRRNGPLRIVSVGRLVSVKGQAVMIAAAEELRRRNLDIELTIVGGGPRRPALERRAERLGVSDRVSFTGALGNDEVLERYAEADLFCLPSFAEGLPFVLMEAMAMELPVVTTRIAGIPELVEDGESGFLVSPGRSDQLADAIERLAADPDLRRRMGEAGRSKVAAEFNLDESARALRDLFAELAA